MMNKSKLKTFAITARIDLLGRVSDRAAFYGLTKTSWEKKTYAASDIYQKPDGSLLTRAEIAQRERLIQRLSERGFDYVIEEAAYTWFNRLIAIRYMQQHMLLPLAMRVLPQAPGQLPQIIEEAHLVELPGLDMGQVLKLIEASRTEALYKYLLITLCNALNASLPQMFETISDYTELLFPDNLLRAESALGLLAQLEDDTWQEIQVIGWLYQYYNTELKDETFELLKKNVKITKDRIGAATQLFTPEWIVRYMVQNSLGRLWLEGHPSPSLHGRWRYYLDEAAQEPEVEAQLQVLRAQRAALRPEDIRLIDPCMGSGHILVYAFDLLIDIYRSVGYTDRDAVESILTHNLYGLDIDDRASQLAYFALMMKACECDKRFLKRGIQPHVYAIQESNSLAAFEGLRGQLRLDTLCLRTANELINAFKDAKIYGSLIPINIDGLGHVDSLIAQLEDAATKSLEVNAWLEKAKGRLYQLAEQAGFMQNKYDVVVTNPPYMGSSGMDAKLSQFVKDQYPDSKSDLFAVFIELCGQMAKQNGYQAMITQHAWMFLSSYETLRKKLMNRDTINMAHLGARAFDDIGGEVVQTTAFVMQKRHTPAYLGTYLRLIDPTTQDGKEEMFLSGQNRYTAQQDNFLLIPGLTTAYWASKKSLEAFSNFDKFVTVAEPRQGLATGDDESFLRYWHEVDVRLIGLEVRTANELWERGYLYAPFNKGGTYKKWYGNNEYVIRFSQKNYFILSNQGNNLPSRQYYFKKGLTWSALTSGLFSVRFCEIGFVFAGKGPMCFPHDENRIFLLCATMNSKPFAYFFGFLSQTMDFNQGQMRNIPINFNIGLSYFKRAEELTSSCIKMAKNDWDSFETSWDFKCHPLL